MSAYYTDAAHPNKNEIPIKRLNEFYGVAPFSKQQNKRIFCDGDFVYVLPRRGVCDDCFLRSYKVFREHVYALSGAHPAPLEDNAVLKARLPSALHPFTLVCIDRASKKQTLYFACCAEGCDQFEKPDASTKALFLNNQNVDLYSFITESSFGLSLYGATFFAQGPTRSILKRDVLATITVPAPSGHVISSPSLCGALDSDVDQARLRAAMEYVERQAFRSFSQNSDTKQGDVLAFINHDEKAFFVKRDQIGGPGSTSSGFAAGFDVAGARMRAAYELVERDAFMRWWARPETARVIEPPAVLRTKFREILCALITVERCGPLDGRFVLLPSPFNIPVVGVFVLSKNPDFAPGFLMSAAAHHDWTHAATKALNELRVGMLNFLARLEAGFALEEGFCSSIPGPEDHARVFYHPSVRARMPFLSHLLARTPTHANVPPASLCENIYYLDCTPKTFEFLGVHVTRAYSPDAIPLRYGFPLQDVDLEPSPLSSFNVLPHPLP